MFVPEYKQKEQISGTTQNPLCVEFGSEVQLPDTGLRPLAAHTNHHTVCVCVFVWVCLCAVVFVWQPIWQYLLSLLQALVLPCCLRSAAALWRPLTITPVKKGGLWKQLNKTVEALSKICFFSLKESERREWVKQHREHCTVNKCILYELPIIVEINLKCCFLPPW